MFRNYLIAAVMGFGVVVSTTESLDAATVVLTPDARGAVQEDGDHNGRSSTNSTLTGLDGGFAEETRSWFAFDLSSITGIIAAATLIVDISDYASPDDSPETLSLVSVETTPGTIGSGAASVPHFVDLANGTDYGSRAFTAADIGFQREITLTAGAIADMQLAIGGLFEIGGYLSSLMSNVEDEALFLGSGSGNITNLSITTAPPVNPTVPEPTSMALFGLTALGMAGVRRRRKKASEELA